MGDQPHFVGVLDEKFEHQTGVADGAPTGLEPAVEHPGDRPVVVANRPHAAEPRLAESAAISSPIDGDDGSTQPTTAAMKGKRPASPSV